MDLQIERPMQADVKERVQHTAKEMNNVCDLLDAMKRLELHSSDAGVLYKPLVRLESCVNDCKMQVGLNNSSGGHTKVEERAFEGNIARANNDKIPSVFTVVWSIEGITAPSDHSEVDIAAINHVAQDVWEETDVGKQKEAFGRGLTREVLKSLKDGGELVSEVVNEYFHCIQRRADKSSTLPSIHVMSDTLFPLLRIFGYDAVQNATDEVDVFSKDMIMFPINNHSHWYLMVADMRETKIRCYDSMTDDGDEYIVDRTDVFSLLHAYLMKECRKKKFTELEGYWELIVMEKDKVPQQAARSLDCGVVMCKVADYIATDRKPDFTGEHIAFFRRLMIAELVEQYLYRH